jgi:signal transduction histidine kinase/CheY-like chemotaxis protein/HPt (histidine-containing phosphotransfer) domain-containing protein
VSEAELVGGLVALRARVQAARAASTTEAPSVAAFFGLLEALTHDLDALVAGAEQLSAGRVDDHARLDEIGDVLFALAALDFEKRASLRLDDGRFDGLAATVNMLSEELAASRDMLAEQHRELARARDAAEQATRAKSQFLANMSHEIRTPLTALLGFADLLVDPSVSASERLNYALVIRRNGEHLLDLINDLLDLSRIEAGKLAVDAIEASLPHVLSDLASLMRVRAAESGLDFGVHLLTPIPATLRTEPTRIRQILLNLVGNAVKFTRKGSVHVLVRHEPRVTPPRLAIDVVDTGIGMSAEQTAALFQPFQQADPSMSRRYGGTGLGLAISKALAELLGGTLGVRSALDEGSTFTLTLPAVVPEGTPLVRSLTELTSAAGGDRASGGSGAPDAQPQALTGRILLAEDGPDNQLLLCALLRRLGLDVRVANDGRSAVELASEAALRGAPFDVVLMDMQMPVLDGYQATAALRRDGYSGAIVALTAHAMVGERERCLAAGCDDYVAKPVDRAVLTRAIADRLRDRASPTESAPTRAADAGAGDATYSRFEDDPTLAPLIERFVETLPARIDALRELGAAGERESFDRQLHQLKGAAGSYGFPTITAAAAEAERAVRDGAAPREAVGPLVAECARVRMRGAGEARPAQHAHGELGGRA